MKTIVSLSATPTLYHITTCSKAVAIMFRDRFELKPSDGTDAEEDAAKSTYYLSTTRSKLGSYTQRSIYTNSAIFVLNGTALGQKHKIKPVDYWQLTDLDPRIRSERDEAEDRVLSRTPTIPARKYIIEIHAHAGEEGDVSRINAVRLKRMCLLNKVKVYFYNTTADLLLMDKRKAVPLGLKIPTLKGDGYVPSREYEIARMKERRHNALRGWIEIANVPVPDNEDEMWKLSKTLSRYGEMAFKRLRYDDAISGLKSDMHNAKSVPYGQPRGERESLDKLITLLRKRKETVKQFVDALRLKWYKR